MKHRSIRLFLGLSGIVTALAFTSNSVLAANHGNYKNQNSTQTISEDVSDLVSGTKGKMQVYADHDDAVDVYMSFDDYKKAMELNAEQIDANTENIATESDIYSSSKTYKQGGLCIKDGSLYQCTSEITTPEAWNASHWKKISLSDAFNSLNKDLIETKKSVSDGKSSLASAITAKGVTTSADATFATMTTNVGKISTKVSSASSLFSQRLRSGHNSSCSGSKTINSGQYTTLVFAFNISLEDKSVTSCSTNYSNASQLYSGRVDDGLLEVVSCNKNTNVTVHYNFTYSNEDYDNCTLRVVGLK